MDAQQETELTISCLGSDIATLTAMKSDPEKQAYMAANLPWLMQCQNQLRRIIDKLGNEQINEAAQ